MHHNGENEKLFVHFLIPIHGRNRDELKDEDFENLQREIQISRVFLFFSYSFDLLFIIILE